MKKTYLLILFLLALVAFVVVLKLSFSQDASKQASNQLPSITQKPTKVPTPTQTIEELTKDWKTYKNSSFAYEIKYPSDWIQITKDSTNFIFEPHAKDAKIFSSESIRSKKIPLNSWIAANWNPFRSYTNVSTSSATVSDIQSTEFSYTNKSNNNYGKVVFIPVSTDATKETVLEIFLEYQQGAPAEEYTMQYNQMLSTFKLTK